MRSCGGKQAPNSRASRQIGSRWPLRVGDEGLHPAGGYNASARRSQDLSSFAIARNSHRARAHCLARIEANTMAPAFEKRKSFIARSTGKETGGRAQICLPQPGFGAKFKGLGKFQTWHKLIGLFSKQSIYGKQGTMADGSRIFLTEGLIASAG